MSVTHGPMERAALVAPHWRGTDDEWSDLVGACLLGCPRHHPTFGAEEAPCGCAGVLADTRFLDRLLFVRRTNARYAREIGELREAIGRRTQSDLTL